MTNTDNQPITAQTYAQQRDQALRQFGEMLRRWRERNGWTQHTPSQWARVAGFQVPAAGNISNLERGLAGSPSPSTLFMLADLNRRIAQREWGPVTDRLLRDRLLMATPITTADGTPWGPTEFWAASVGLQDIPPDLQAPRNEPMPVVDRAELCDRWRHLMADAITTYDLDPLELVEVVSKVAPPDGRRRLRQALTVPGYTLPADDLPALWVNLWLPEQRIEQVIGQG